MAGLGQWSVSADAAAVDVQPLNALAQEGDGGSSLQSNCNVKEMSPEPGSCKEYTGQNPPLLHQLLGAIPSPARALASPARGVVSTSPVAPWKSPPPPPILPAPICHAARDFRDLSQDAAPPLAEPSCPSYRERLRAGGRGAFQRAFDAGLVPKSMKQDAVPQMETAPYANNSFQQQRDSLYSTHMFQSAPMSYTSAIDSQSMWSATGMMLGEEYWPAQVGNSQAPTQHPCFQQRQTILQNSQELGNVQQMQGQPNLLVQSVPQQLQLQSQLPHTPQANAQQMHLSHMRIPQSPMPNATNGDATRTGQVAQIHAQQVQLPQMQTSQMPVQSAATGEATPTELDRCMAIIMPQATQFPCDKDLMAAQLKAAADFQRYED